MSTYLLIGLGSGLGGVLRYATIATALTLFGPSFPVGTIFVNVIGSGVIGVLAALARSESMCKVGPRAHALLAVGFCGGFTTYSFFGWHVHWLAMDDPVSAATYAILTNGLSFAAVALGYQLTTRQRSP